MSLAVYCIFVVSILVQIFPAIMDVFSELYHKEFSLVIATRPTYSSQFHYDYTVFPGQ